MKKYSTTIIISLISFYILTYISLRVSSALVRTNIVTRDKVGTVINQSQGVQIYNNQDSKASKTISQLYFPLWQMEFKIRNIDY